MLEEIKQHIFNIGWFLFAIINWIISKFLRHQNNGSHEQSATVYQIWFHYKPPQNLDLSNKADFLCTFSDFTHPSVLLDENISLYYLTAREAVFVDCGGIDVFDSRYHAFVYNAQFRYATRLIIVPIESFHLMAQQIDLPTVPMLHVANHGRCGSTLLSKVFEAIPNSFAVSEMNAFTSIAEISRKGHIDLNKLKQLCFGATMFMLKHCNARKSKIVFFKCQNIAVYITDLLIGVIPSIKHIYMYRQPISFIRSYEKLFAINHWPKSTVKECKFWAGIGHNELLKGTPVYPYHMLNRLHFVSKLSLYWITGAAAFDNLLKKGYAVKSFKFEDFVSEPKKNVLALFNFANIPDELIPDLDAVLAKDSQAGTEYTSRRFKKEDLEALFTKFTDEIKYELDGLCHDFKVPLFWNDIQLPNKI